MANANDFMETSVDGFFSFTSSCMTIIRLTSSRAFLLIWLVGIVLNLILIAAAPESTDSLALLAFIAYVPYFCMLYRHAKQHNRMVYAISVSQFVVISTATAFHFGIALPYGFIIGVFQGFLIPVLCRVQSSEASDLRWVAGLICAWVSVDYLIATLLGIAVTLPIQLYRYPLLIQPVALLGFSSLDALLAAANCLVSLFMSRIGSQKSLAYKSRPIGLLLLVLAIWYSVAYYLWVQVETAVGTAVKVATISPGYRFNGDPSDLVSLTLSASSDGARFIVWPEVYVRPEGLNQTCEEYVSTRLLPLLEKADAYIVIGCAERLSGTCPTANLAITVSPEGRIIGSYGKQHPVTMIGEQSCIRNGYRNYPIQSSLISKDPVDLSFSTLICYDMDFGNSPSIVADQGVSLILNPSEDWAAARGHFAASVFRAVENRVVVAKSDWGWDSAIIQANGVIQTMYDTERMHRETLMAEVNLVPQGSTHNRLRLTILPWTCMLLCIFFQWRLRRRLPPSDPLILPQLGDRLL